MVGDLRDFLKKKSLLFFSHTMGLTITVVIMGKCRRHDSAIAQEIYLFHFFVVDNATKVTIICMNIAK